MEMRVLHHTRRVQIRSQVASQFVLRPCPLPRLRHGTDDLSTLVTLVLEVEANSTSKPLSDLPLSRSLQPVGCELP